MDLLLAESGSSKTDWVLFRTGGGKREFRTSGTNPDVQQADVIRSVFLRELLPELGETVPSQIFFYGAGLRNPQNREVLSGIFKGLFPGCKPHIEHDLLGSARACCGDAPGIACILGTGSNSCYFDGKEIISEKGGNGFLFGDEGSGADLGKALIKSALDELAPLELVKEMEVWSGKSLLDIRRSVHLSEKINVALASWSPFVARHIAHPFVSAMVAQRFASFLELTVLRYPESSRVPVHFVGSVASVYQEILVSVCNSFGLRTGNILKEPAPSLMQYHLSHV